jgi:hypothetical protein
MLNPKPAFGRAGTVQAEGAKPAAVIVDYAA